MEKYQVTIDTFDKLAARYQEKYLKYPPYLQSFAEFEQRLNSQAKSVLEIGCGPGSMSLFLQQQRPELRLAGFDASPAMIALAQQNIPLGDFWVMDARQLNQVDQIYDALVCAFCIPYLQISDVLQLITAMNSRCVCGGLIYLSWILGDYEKSCYQTSSSGEQCFVHYYDELQLMTAIRQQGFAPLSVKQYQMKTTTGEQTEIFVIAEKERGDC